MYFSLSLFLHLAILFSMISVWTGYPKPDKKPSMTIPSYTYQNQSSPAMQEASQKKILTDKNGVEKNASISTASQVRHASHSLTNTQTKVTEAINLVGDKKIVPKPLIILLGKALTAHLVYPKIAVDFKIHGMAFVGFVLHPDGTLSNIQLVQSSKAGVLDDEALAAVSAISPLKNVSSYVSQPKPMVVGIIFN